MKEKGYLWGVIWLPQGSLENEKMSNSVRDEIIFPMKGKTVKLEGKDMNLEGKYWKKNPE